MTFPKTHGIAIRKGGWVENLVAEPLATDPVIDGPGRIWYNTTEDLYKGSFRDPDTGNLIIKAFLTEGDLKQSLLDLEDTPNDYGQTGQVLTSTGDGVEWGIASDWPHVFHGDNEPTLDIGVLGDYYLNVISNYFYYKQMCSGSQCETIPIDTIKLNFDQTVELLLISDWDITNFSNWSWANYRSPMDLSKNRFIVRPFIDPDDVYDTVDGFKFESGALIVQSKLGMIDEVPDELCQNVPWFPETNPFTLEFTANFNNIQTTTFTQTINWSDDSFSFYFGDDNGKGCLSFISSKSFIIHKIEFFENSSWVDRSDNFYSALYDSEFDNCWFSNSFGQLELALESNIFSTKPTQIRVTYSGTSELQIVIYDEGTDHGYGIDSISLEYTHTTPVTLKNVYIVSTFQGITLNNESTSLIIYYENVSGNLVIEQTTSQNGAIISTDYGFRFNSHYPLINNNEYKFAICGTGSTLRFFINGKSYLTRSYDRIRRIESLQNRPYNIYDSEYFGLLQFGDSWGKITSSYVNNTKFVGYMQNIRWSNICRYESTYVPISGNFPIPGIIPSTNDKIIDLCINDNTISNLSGKSFVYTYNNCVADSTKTITGNNSIKFSSINSGVYCTYNYDMNIYQNDEITLQFWINLDYDIITINDNYPRNIVSISDDHSGFSIKHDSWQIIMEGDNGWSCKSVDVSDWIANTWHHIAIVYQNGQLVMFTDGIKSDDIRIPTVEFRPFDGYNLIPKDLFIGSPLYQYSSHGTLESFQGNIDGFEWVKNAIYETDFNPWEDDRTRIIVDNTSGEENECWKHIATLKGEDGQTITTILELSDTPTGYGTTDQFLAMDSTGTKLVWKTPNNQIVNLVDLNDTPNSLGTSNQILGMSSDGSQIVWKDLPAPPPGNIIDLNDTPIGYGSPGQILIMDPIEQKLIWTDNTSINSGSYFIYNSTSASSNYIISHNLNSTNLILTTWVQQLDGSWTKDEMEHKIIDSNNILVNLAEIKNIKVIIQAVGGM